MNPKPTVVSIHIASTGRSAMQRVSEAHAVAGKGLEGDRYYSQSGTFSRDPGSGRELTLIEAEAIEALNRDYQVPLGAESSRRNIVTRGVALNHLVGREFGIGEVVARGTRLCEPCAHMEKLTVKGVMRGLIHRGGLRAEIVRGGIIRVGDAIRLEDS